MKMKYHGHPILAKVDPLFVEMCKEVERERYMNKKDKKPIGIRRTTLAIARHKPMWDILKLADLKDDKRGQMAAFSLLNIMIVAFIAVVFFGGLIYVSGLLNDVFQQVGQQNEANAGQPGYVNMTKAANDTFGQMNSGVQSLRLVAICLIFAEILLAFVTGAFQAKHPALFFVYILVVILMVIFSATISNAYYSLLSSDVYGGLLVSFTGANWILLNLPMIILVTGVLASIFLFVNLVKGGSDQVGI